MKATGWRPADTGTIQGDARVHESASGPVVAGGSSQKGWEGLAPAQSIPIEAVGHLSAEALAQGVGGKRPSPALSNLLEQIRAKLLGESHDAIELGPSDPAGLISTGSNGGAG